MRRVGVVLPAFIVLAGFKLNTVEVAGASQGAAVVPHSYRFVVLDPTGEVRAALLEAKRSPPDEVARTLRRVRPGPQNWFETGDIVLVKSDPADVLAAIRLSKATVRKMKQNLFWAAIYNVVAIPVAAGVLYPSLGIMLRPEFGALAMSASSITVVSNALLLRREA